jgi:hypothetical protein
LAGIAARAYERGGECLPGADALAIESAWLGRLLWRAFALRAGVAVILAVTGLGGRLAPDSGTYASAGQSIALYWAGETLVRPGWLSRQMPLGYFYMNAASAYLFGDTGIPLGILNAVAGALVCRYVYLIARELFGSSVARRAASYAAYFPSLVLWSAVNIRDIWVILIIVAVSWKSIQVVRGYSHLGLVTTLALTATLGQFREYLFFVVAFPPLAAYLLGPRGHPGRNLLLSFLGGIGVVLLVQHGVVGEAASRHLSLEAVTEAHRGFAAGGSAYEEDVDVSTPGKALAFLPKGLAYFFFSPFPWQMTTTLRLFSLPEMLLIYWMTLSAIRGLRYAVQHRLRESLQLLLLTGLLTVAYALGAGNVGTLYRHRAQAFVFYLVFAAVGRELVLVRSAAEGEGERE